MKPTQGLDIFRFAVFLGAQAPQETKNSLGPSLGHGRLAQHVIPQLCMTLYDYVSGVNILHYFQIKHLGKVSLFLYFGEEFLHVDKCF